MAEISYRRHCFSPVIIQHTVWLYLRFTLSYRDVEELLAQRGLDISYELTSATNWGWARLPFTSANRRCRHPRRRAAAGLASRDGIYLKNAISRLRPKACAPGVSSRVGSHR
jgi:transposase-like protein